MDERRQREFDIIVYGASGFTGGLVAEHLASTHAGKHGLRLALGGRNEAKLSAVAAELGGSRPPPCLLADADELPALIRMAAQTKVIVTTAGPFQLYGTKLVEACATAGTDYLDLSGEANWVPEMVARYHAPARASGARLIFTAGFESVPFDLGLFFLQQQAEHRYGTPAPHVSGRIRGISGGASGGTAATARLLADLAGKDADIDRLMEDPFALTPGFAGPRQPAIDRPYLDDCVRSWVAPFPTAHLNSMMIHRTNYLLDQAWGSGFLYDEMIMIPDPSISPPLPDMDLGRALRPGEGPAKAERDAGFYDLLFIGKWPGDRMLRTSVHSDSDPGYGSTSRIVGECAMCLIENVGTSAGGCWTTASLMGAPLIERMQRHAGLTFKLED